MTTALATTNPTAIARPEALTALTVQFPADRFNVLAPVVHLPSLPVGCRIAVTEVRVSGAKDAKETFAIAGGDKMLGKVVLDRIAAAAGISWLEEKRCDDRRHPYYVEMSVRGRITDFDGTVRELTGHKIIDLREDAGGDTPGKDYAEIVSKNKDPARQLMEARKFIAEIAVSKAKNRAIASALGIKRAYSDQELSRPFVVPKLMLDPNDPTARQAILAGFVGATSAMFGKPPERVIDATFEPMPEQAAPENASPAGAAGGGQSWSSDSPPASTAVPAHDPKTGEVKTGTRDVIDLVKSAWGKAKESGMTPEAFRALCKANTGVERKEEMSLDHAQSVAKAVLAYAESKAADGDVPV